MSDSRRVSYFYDAEVGNYHYGQGKLDITIIPDISNATIGDIGKTLPVLCFFLTNHAILLNFVFGR